MTAAAVTARALLKVFIARNTAQFESLLNDLMDALLHFLHFILCVDERFGDGVGKKCVAFGLERRDFLAIQWEALMLFLVQRAAFFSQALILLLRFRVGHE